jgi:hypothetical protein
MSDTLLDHSSFQGKDTRIYQNNTNVFEIVDFILEGLAVSVLLKILITEVNNITLTF